MAAKKTEKKITLEDFIAKSVKKYNERKLVAEIEVDGDELVFTRPTDEETLKYLNGVSNAVKIEKGEYGGQDIELMLEASKDFVFATCKYLQSKELQGALEAIEPTDVVVKLFGIEGTIDLAQQVKDAFDPESAVNETDELVKNL